MRARISSVCFLLAVGCSGADGGPDAGAQPDARVVTDAAVPDAAAPPDGGLEADAGIADTGPMSCGDCGAPTTCAEPFCDETTWTCDPGYLTMSLDDEAAGDCMGLACDGAHPEPVVVVDDTDLPPPPADVCGAPACDGGIPGVGTATAGTACQGQAGVCDGQGLTADSCKRCADTEADVFAVDPGCTRVRNFCYEDESLSRGGCFPATAWDDTWGSATIGTDGLTVANLGTSTANVRSTYVANSGKLYWEVKVVSGDAMVNGGGIGIVAADAQDDISYIGSGPTGVSFGYAMNPQYFSGWSGISFPSGNPPDAVYLATGRVFMIALDLDTGRMWVGSEGIWYNGGDPESGVNPAVEGIPGRIRAGATLYEGSTALEANFMGPFQFPVPAGFRPGFF